MNKYSCLLEWGENIEGGMALKFYGMYSIYFIILIHIISNYLTIFTYMYSCNIWDYMYVNMSRYLIHYARSLYLMCIVQNVLTYIFIYVYVYITVRLVFFFFHSLRQVQWRHMVHKNVWICWNGQQPTHCHKSN